MKLSLIYSLLPLAAIACSSSSSTSSTTDSGSSDATVGDAPTGDAGVTVTCTRTTADLCASPGSADCPYPTFASARAASCCAAQGCFVKVTSSTCGGYDVAEARGIDTVTSYYYDHANGNLVAVVRFGSSLVGGYVCGAGPATFDTPSCAETGFACVPGGDAGTDGASDASGD